MDVYRHIEDVLVMNEAVLTIGSYDGLHRGHQEVINRVVTTAKALNTKSVVVPFDPHPKKLFLARIILSCLCILIRNWSFLTSWAWISPL